VYGFAAGINYRDCKKAFTNDDLTNSIGEAMGDGAARLGAGLYELCHNEKDRSVTTAIKVMPKSKVQKELKDKDFDKVIAILQNGAKGAGVTISTQGHHTWRLGETSRGGETTVAYVTDYGHIVIEARLPEPVPSVHRMEVVNLIDPVNMGLLGKMSFAIVDLNDGQAAVRTGVRVNKGIDKFEPQIIANMIQENKAISSVVLPGIKEVAAGTSAEAAFVRLIEQLPVLSDTRSLVINARFLFRM
jgi:hypothetical protein